MYGGSMSKNSEAVIRTQQRNKLRAVEYLGGKCSICNYNKCLAALDFHHLDPLIKESSPTHAIHCWSWERAKIELDKCILVCSNCHREIHHGMHEIKSLQKYFRLEICKICPVCNEEFITKNEEQILCSPRCSQIYRQKLNRPTKDELFELVWLKPTTHIAKQYGVSGKAIEKWCKNYGIEKPGNGYWSKKRHGLI